MDNRLKINQPIQPLKRTEQQNKAAQKNKNPNSPSFKDILGEKMNGKNELSFSKHAQKRIKSRAIPVSKTELDKLSTGVEKARDKGARDSLVMVNDVAYIVSVENNTVVTAVDEASMDDNVFTNIDSAVFMK
ncbi:MULTISPECIES: TIGR02530 family flagellar biosynthesis protein [Halanaerobium]|jgi:flagellar operon protein|uniref:Flagellar operon protein n=1 Tax=Halanaerobium congolense TaxID=54121 RepID=A0A4R8G9L5_9FIRM|nr:MULTISPECIES: TIGR02530 family flagellar biosynthesis protein [Halanaerobium]KXS49961.1 MAG: flagellar operon protein [Halanaerobium sp. T82-1]PUU87849.1 MAG: flagellar operon protein [Halanaerobium sp.]TDP26346.1 flagellar operon protein [Halanaerobium congolense]TDX38579.1 flagellar operon protein [Halanaerobium congolense]